MKLKTLLGLTFSLVGVCIIATGCETDREVITPGKTTVVHDKASPTVIVKDAPPSTHTETNTNTTTPANPSTPPDPGQQTTTSTTTTGN